MADFELDLSSVTRELEEDIQDTVIRRFALGVFSRVQRISPVDTGRFRTNWDVEFDGPSSYFAPDATSPESKGQVSKSALQRGRAKIEGFSLDNNESIYITNNLPYSRRLEFEGYSSQATNGIASLALREEAAAFEKYGNS